MKTMGQRIHDKRVEHQLSMQELGDKLGVQRQTVSKWEHGEVQNLKRSMIAKLASILHCSPVWLMGYEDSPEVTLTYEAPKKEPIKLVVDHEPIIGPTSKIAELYSLILAIDPKNYDLAIKILKSLQKEE